MPLNPLTVLTIVLAIFACIAAVCTYKFRNVNVINKYFFITDVFHLTFLALLVSAALLMFDNHGRYQYFETMKSIANWTNTLEKIECTHKEDQPSFKADCEEANRVIDLQKSLPEYASYIKLLNEYRFNANTFSNSQLFMISNLNNKIKVKLKFPENELSDNRNKERTEYAKKLSNNLEQAHKAIIEQSDPLLVLTITFCLMIWLALSRYLEHSLVGKKKETNLKTTPSRHVSDSLTAIPNLFSLIVIIVFITGITLMPIFFYSLE